MRFYPKTHQHYCGIDLHGKTMYLCILDREGQILRQKDLRSRPEAFLEAVSLDRRLAGKHGKGKALSILAAKLGRAVDLILTKERVFDMDRFLAGTA